MRMGIMGGTLDPVHNGHLEIAQAVRALCGLDGVMLLPAGNPPHKRHKCSGEDRLQMARLAAEDQPGMTVSEIEVLRQGTTYTVDTLTELHERQPEVEWVYIIGADTVNVLDSWRSFERVAQLCAFAALERPGCDSERARAHAQRLRERYGVEIQFLNASGPDISSSQVRALVAEGKPVADLVPKKVGAYIRENGLYLCDYSWEDLREKLAGMLKPARFAHTLGVAETAGQLASLYGIDPQRARLAGMLHDCAKSMEYGDMVELIRGSGLDVTEDELAMAPVVHAPAGSIVAAREFGVKDPEILSAIRNHTLGGPGMTDLELLIFLADYIEPNRKPFDGLEEVRNLAKRDLRAAVIRSAQLSGEHVVRQGGQRSVRTVQMLKELGGLFHG